MAAPEFVVVGHVTLDRIDGRVRPGGAALYAALTAHRLGLSVGILTSHGDDFPLDVLPPQIEVVTTPAARTTVFEHEQVDGTRTLRVTDAAGPITAEDVPEDWRDAQIVLLAPVFNEVDPRIVIAFPEASIGAAAQGWLRALGADGLVTPATWEPPEFLVGALQALFLSREDIGEDSGGAVAMFQRVPVGALTAGADGALLFVSGESYEVPPRPAQERDGTGAGDVFAAAFLIDYHQNGQPWDAAALAACAGSLAVEGAGPEAIPNRADLDLALKAYLATD
jgi:1D-myo-inositol 3-kinase